MRDIEDFYILGLPIETELGNAEFIKVKEYPDYFADLQTIGMSKLEIIHNYHKLNKNNELDEFIEELEKHPLFELAVQIPELAQSYVNIFAKVFNDDTVLEKVNIDNFDYYRKLIMRMNCIREEEINPNPEIQRAIERSRRVKSQDSEGVTFTTIVTSVSVNDGLPVCEINEMSIYELYQRFYRISQIKGYETSTLFATVSSEKINIESWCKNIDLFEKEKHFISQEEFKKTTGKVFNE